MPPWWNGRHWRFNMNKVYGPYDCSDGRKRVIHNGKTKLYARYLLEQKLGRELLSHEDVDHINDNFSDDSIDNLQVFTCICGKESWQYAKNVRGNKKKVRSGPYCSKRCAGKYGHPSYKARVSELA